MIVIRNHSSHTSKISSCWDWIGRSIKPMLIHSFFILSFISDIVKLLLSYNAQVNVRNECGNTPLHWASLNGHKDVVQVMVEHGVDRSVKNQFGSTAFAEAFKQEKYSVCDLLVEEKDIPLDDSSSSSSSSSKPT